MNHLSQVLIWNVVGHNKRVLNDKICGKTPLNFTNVRFYSALRRQAYSSRFLFVNNKEWALLVSEPWEEETFKQNDNFNRN